MMPSYRNLSLRSLLVAFIVLLVVMLAATLYPFNFSPANGVEWLPNEAGLYLNGNGIAYTGRGKSVYATNAISVELWLKERFGSKNWGPREIFAFYDRSASPSLLIGQWGGRIFLYSRFERNEGDKYYKLFRTKYRFPRGEPHFVTVTFGEGVKAIYIDGQLNDKRRTEIHDETNIGFSGSLMLGNSPAGRRGWWGEVKGLAIYNRVLLPKEIMKHSSDVFQMGMRGLAETPGCLALYPFDEGEGNTAESIVGKSRPFSIPTSLAFLDLASILYLPHKNMRIGSKWVADFLRNILLFFPYGILLSAIILRKYTIGYFVTFLIVTSSGCLLSLTIEFLQLFLPARIPGIADLLSNTIGSGLGVLVGYSLEMKG